MAPRTSQAARSSPILGLMYNNQPWARRVWPCQACLPGAPDACRVESTMYYRLLADDMTRRGRDERRRTGPLGDDDVETRRVPTENGAESARQGEGASSATRGAGTGPSEDNETRVIGASGYPDTTRAATPYPRGYFEEVEEREDRLRDMYGGVDWLASFLGFIFSTVLGGVFLAIAGLVLVPFGITPELSGGQIGASVLTGLAVLGVLIFLTYFFGGYVAGRLARFDGGRNGAMVLVWTFIVVLILALAALVFSGFLPAGAAESIANLVERIISAGRSLLGAGVVGIVSALAGVLLALLGGFLGGRLGSRYHTEIDRAT